ncbi:MAG TPA: ATP-binding protein [Stellaceae bacterium]|nr:ATP-binding protein [Stellaceae bacterium]
MTTETETTNALLARIAGALERLSPPPIPPLDLKGAEAFVWHAARGELEPVPKVNRVDLGLLHGVERVRDILLDNTRRFAAGYPANNALLWGSRGMGKSSLVKAVHGAVAAELPAEAPRLVLVEIHREDIPSLPQLLGTLRNRAERCILFCDDLSFDHDDAAYKSLKAVLDGGIEGRPANVVLYATSNRRHLMPRDMIDNERSSAVNPGEANEEKISLSDRFGLWLGFYGCDQPTYLAMIRGYAARYGLDLPEAELVAEANEWSVTRGARSGRVAWQFIQDLAGRQRKRLD